jgi:hypothetical protein
VLLLLLQVLQRCTLAKLLLFAGFGVRLGLELDAQTFPLGLAEGLNVGLRVHRHARPLRLGRARRGAADDGRSDQGNQTQFRNCVFHPLSPLLLKI